MSATSLIPFIPFILAGLLLAVAWWRHRVRESGGGAPKAPEAAPPAAEPRRPRRRSARR
ncbi:hypothetical protein [Actinomadura craniellae]|uniref:hypothetical protein n=1 Tax=Actinomadura craniellae TaxID=2231787 RepID=UPI0013140AC3|nr:hypothetical protein [Actinomadura craniellae]